MTRKRGTCVLVGLPLGEFPAPLANCITIRGSFVGTRQDMAEALAALYARLQESSTQACGSIKSRKSSRSKKDAITVMNVCFS